jgi:hypothetical protein
MQVNQQHNSINQRWQLMAVSITDCTSVNLSLLTPAAPASAHHDNFRFLVRRKETPEHRKQLTHCHCPIGT